ncbi:MBL fold metallo-hydrolase [Botryobacter ruber]|uniref:MBL fold metallo-hydrolase n=1 Tax=Botryobacter ruber TaxID=2171629 RepID=UPI001F0B7455|nr:MBL fold metallo-hydrolase [Botryobacter ruber]
METRTKVIRMAVYIVSVTLLLLTLTGSGFLNLAPQFGGKIKGERLERVQQSPNYSDGVFQNPVETSMDLSVKEYFKLFGNYLNKGENLEPDWVIPVQEINPQRFRQRQDTATVITWFGHSAFLVELDGKRLLLDPMLGNVASPVSFIGPERFNEKLPISIEDLPAIDAVLLSHDHYDHLDYGSIMGLKEKVAHFFVPLGLGAHLEAWGVPAKNITELDWWQEASYQGLTFVSTPARHFSGRGLTDRMETLWTSWVIRGRNDKLFFSGDTGYFDGFKEIGEKYGPFDLTMVECGQYNEMWSDIHMMPEQTVQAHLDLRGKLLMPIHWGAFRLALHPWTEPIERARASARAVGVPIATPVIGAPFVLHQAIPSVPWWR